MSTVSSVSSESQKVQYSVQRELSDGSLNRISVRVPYFSKDDIHVYVNDIEITSTASESSEYTWRWDGDYISITPNVTSGVEVLVRRITPIDEAIHIFDGRSEFDDQSMDENFQQLIYIAQEYSEGSGIKDVFSDINMHGYKIRNVGRATDDDDVVTYGQYREDTLGARQARDEAKQYATNAKASENKSKAIADATALHKDSAKDSADEAARQAKNAEDWANSIKTAYEDAEDLIDEIVVLSENKKNELIEISGTYYIPAVDNLGNLTWTNTGNKENPPKVNIRGLRGPQGSGLEIKDTYSTYEEFIADHPTGKESDVYFVGNDLYIWSVSSKEWVNKGPIVSGGIAGLMDPDPREYFLYILGESGSEDPEEPEEDPSYSPVLNTGKLNYLVLA